MAKTEILTKDGLVIYDGKMKNYIKDLTDDTVYIDPDEESTEIEEIESTTKAEYVSYDNTTSNLEVTTVQEAIDITASIAKGKNRARVFNTTDDMNTWLSDKANKSVAIVGDNLYIVDTNVPDWWISEVLDEADSDTGFYYKIVQLGTQKVDLTTIESDITTLNSEVQLNCNVILGNPTISAQSSSTIQLPPSKCPDSFMLLIRSSNPAYYFLAFLMYNASNVPTLHKIYPNDTISADVDSSNILTIYNSSVYEQMFYVILSPIIKTE